MRLIDADELKTHKYHSGVHCENAVAVYYIDNAPTVEAYTKQEVIDMLYDITHQIQETEKVVDSNLSAYWWKEGVRDSVNVIQSRIAILKIVQEKEKKNGKHE